MTDTQVVHIGLEAMLTAAKLGAPVLVTALLVGFAVSLFQSVTLVPKAIGVGVALLASGNWMLHELISFTSSLMAQVPQLISG